MRFVQQTPDCADFDVAPDGADSPAFRVLLPEAVVANGGDIDVGGVHTVRGTWEDAGGGLRGLIRPSLGIQIAIRIVPGGQEIGVRIAVANLSRATMTDVTVDICAGVTHLTGEPGWANRAFIPEDVPLDRDAAGRYWYEHATPHGLAALTDAGWLPMHATPGDPDPDAVAKYVLVVSERPDTRAYAALSVDGRTQFFQAWDVPCFRRAPFPGNACTHLHPIVAHRIEPGGSARIRGVIGLFEGSRDALADHVRAALST